MALPRCGHCGTRDYLEAGTNRVTCLRCGGQSDYDGNALPREPVFLAESHQEKLAREEAERNG